MAKGKKRRESYMGKKGGDFFSHIDCKKVKKKKDNGQAEGAALLARGEAGRA